jgi:diguanylate cyclase
MAALMLWQSLWVKRSRMSDQNLATDDVKRDALTGLPGMEAVRERLAAWIARDRAGEGTRLHALLLTLRRFDTVNLAYGAAAGDAALAAVAARLTQFAASELDGPWIAARSGGSNFILVANESCSRQRWQLFAGQLADLVAKPIPSGADGVLRLSPRVALLRGVGRETSESILDRLGQTVANMRRQQGRRLAWADGETTRAGRTAVQLEADLLRAIDRDEIEVVFQPQFALPEDRLTGAEALARWNHPKLGRIGAGALFGIAERADHVAPLSRHIAGLALAQAKAWPNALRMSLNVTAIELSAESYAGELTDIMRQSGFPQVRLTLEVTEQALTQRDRYPHRTGRFRRRLLQLSLPQAAAARLPQARPFDGRWHRR